MLRDAPLWLASNSPLQSNICECPVPMSPGCTHMQKQNVMLRVLLWLCGMGECWQSKQKHEKEIQTLVQLNQHITRIKISPEALRKVIVGTLHVGEALAKFATCARSCVLFGFPLLSKHGDLAFDNEREQRTQAK